MDAYQKAHLVNAATRVADAFERIATSMETSAAQNAQAVQSLKAAQEAFAEEIKIDLSGDLP
jgi:hypothetical protein